MKIKSNLYILITIVLASIIYTLQCSDAQNLKIRDAVASKMGWYPSDPKQLTNIVDQMLKDAPEPDISGNIIALISPHAGYKYSGHVAASSYSLLKGKKIKRVIVISPSHICSFHGVSIYDGDAYETPLGKIFVDHTFADRLAKKSHLIKRSGKGHTESYGGRGEHALEVQLPFLQRVLGEFKLVPIIMGDQEYETCRTLGIALADLIKNPETIIVASSDLSHFHEYGEAVKMDHSLIQSVVEWDYFNLSRNLRGRIWEACGGSPIITTMIAAERLAATEAKLIKYANSGDIRGMDRSSVVGYAAIAFIKSATPPAKEPFRISKTEQKHLLEIARKSVESVVKDNKRAECSAGNFKSLMQERGAFVTLKKNNYLRGCIGYTAPVKPLYQTVQETAMSAAVKDPRFSPVSVNELDDLTYEISVLSPFKCVLDIKQIEIGIHGLLIKKGMREGLLLPQVATENGWDVYTFLQNTCSKAGLPYDSWKDKDTDIFMFSAFVFGEHKY